MSDKPFDSVDARPFTWLHLADVRFGAGKGPATDPIWDALERNVFSLLPGMGLKPQAVFLTGSITSSGTVADFLAAEKRFSQWAHILKLNPKNHWFVSPGPGDVDHGSIDGMDPLLRDSLNSPEILTKALTKPKTWRSFSDRLGPFLKFTERFLGPERSWAPQQPWEVAYLDLSAASGSAPGDGSVAVLSLNGSWACQDGDDVGNLLLGLHQVEQALHQAKDAALRFALLTQDWYHFKSFDHDACETRLTGSDGVHFLLQTGASPRMESRRHPGFIYHAFSGGERLSQGPTAMIGQADLASGDGSVYSWRYNLRKRYWYEANDLYLEMKRGFWPFRWKPESQAPQAAADKPRRSTKPVDLGPLIPPKYDRFLRGKYDKLDVFGYEDSLPGLDAVYVPMRAQRRFPTPDAAEGAAETAPDAAGSVNEELSAGRHAAEEDAAVSTGAGQAAELPQEAEIEDQFTATRTRLAKGGQQLGVEKRIQDEEISLHQLCEHHLQGLLIVAGSPGIGKSTLLRRQALNELARATRRLPILLEMKEFGDWLALHPETDPHLLPRFAAERLADGGLSLELLTARGEQGRILWLLDGLDEIFVEADRYRAARLLGERFTTPHCREAALITTRPNVLDHRDTRLALGAAGRSAQILPLNPTEQRAYLAGWYTGFYRDQDEGERVCADMWHSLEDRGRQVPEIQDIRGNPLLLSIIAWLYHAGQTLPERRVELYNKAIDALIRRRFGPRAGGSTVLQNAMLGLLMDIAHAMQEAGRPRSIDKTELLKLLVRKRHSLALENLDAEQRGRLEQKLHRLGTHSGIITVVGDPPHFSFQHQGYREFLAARKIMETEAPVETLAALADNTAWREVVLQATGLMLDARQGAGKAFLRRMMKQAMERPPSLKSRFLHLLKGRAAVCVDVPRLTFTLQAALEAIPSNIPPLDRRELEKAALQGLAEPSSAAKERQELGLMLGRFGDPRLGLRKRERWVELSAARFTMGNDQSEDDDEKPAHQVYLSQGFKIGRYPVTNEEFRPFIEDGGYNDKTWWSEEGKLWCWKYQEWLKRFELEDQEYFQPHAKPRFWGDERFNQANQPVVGVSWYEAEAFCRWLTARYEVDPPEWWQQGVAIMLPTEAQWEYAARGESGRIYPWGNAEPSHETANYGGVHGEGLGQTNAVGIFPKGATPDGVFELGGGVWEWCRDVWNVEAYKSRGNGVKDPLTRGDKPARVLRGGSWFNPAGFLAASCRSRGLAGYRSNVIGFRLVVSLPREHDH